MENEDEAAQQMSEADEEIYRRNVHNLGNLIRNIFPEGVFFLSVIPDRNKNGMLATHNIHISNYEIYMEAAQNLAKAMCEASEANRDPNRTIN